MSVLSIYGPIPAQIAGSTDLTSTTQKEHRLGLMVKALSPVCNQGSIILVPWLHDYGCTNTCMLVTMDQLSQQHKFLLPPMLDKGAPPITFSFHPLIQTSYVFHSWCHRLPTLCLVSVGLNKASSSFILSYHPCLTQGWCVPVPSPMIVFILHLYIGVYLY